MKNKAISILAVLVLCIVMVIPVSAVSTHIFDSTNHIENIDEVESYAQKIDDTYNFSVLLAVVDKIEEGDTIEYSEELFNEYAENEDGIVLTYNYGENRYGFYRAGQAETLFSTEVCDNVLWKAFAYTETYYQGVYAYLAAVESFLQQAPGVVTDTADDATTEPSTEFVPVDRKLKLVEDYADVLTDEEEAELLGRLEALGVANELEIGAITVDSYEGKDPQAFADDFYDYNDYGYGENDDGLIVVFNTGEGDGNRNIAISTHGRANDLVSGSDISIIIEMMIPSIKNGDFAGAFDNFVTECENAVDTSVPLIGIPIAIIIGFGFAFLIVKIQASKLKTVKQQADAADYVSGVMLTGEYDNFLYKDVKVVAKPKSNSSSTHTSSSGRTHGGGNSSF